ncbi:MAG: thioether cross-link-forming SCIFF peptide maturase [Ruminococcaceae bacterium]|nr:thioether cross-link-forming SCIFF peptide maturase [Oscillospiraceae bacterium]
MIHKFCMDDVRIVCDVYSGAVHVVSPVVYDLLDHVDELSPALTDEALKALSPVYGEETVREAFDEIDELYRAGALFAPDGYAEIAKHWSKQPVVKALCLHITHDCNLRCKYCFADTGEYGGGKRSFMSPEVGKKAIDFVIANSAKRKNIEIDFFGGEPLMNFDAVKEILEYAEEQGKEHDKHFRFTITTNGLLLDDEKIAYINEHMGNIVLSIDGRKEVNDAVRTRVDGTGCYDKILPRFKQVAESRNQDNYYVRGTFTANNLDFSLDALHLADLGFEQISIEPVVLADGHPLALKEEHLPKLYDEYESLARAYVKRRANGQFFNFFHFMMDFSQGPCAYKRLAGCGAGCEYVAVTPDGDIFPCHQFVGNNDYKMGNVFDGKLNPELQGKFAATNIYTKDACRDCWAKFYCSGGCMANAVNFNGDVNKPYEIACDLERKRVECAMYIAAKEQG